jgi:hypothetical protein
LDLDERTRKIGLRVVARLRAVLRQARPPEPKHAQDRKGQLTESALHVAP